MLKINPNMINANKRKCTWKSPSVFIITNAVEIVELKKKKKNAGSDHTMDRGEIKLHLKREGNKKEKGERGEEEDQIDRI